MSHKYSSSITFAYSTFIPFMSDPSIYLGISRRLVITLDIGTTFSGISYCILEHGEVPKVCNVSRYDFGRSYIDFFSERGVIGFQAKSMSLDLVKSRQSYAMTSPVECVPQVPRHCYLKALNT